MGLISLYNKILIFDRGERAFCVVYFDESKLKWDNIIKTGLYRVKLGNDFELKFFKLDNHINWSKILWILSVFFKWKGNRFVKIEKIFNLRDIFSLEEEIEGVVFFRNIFDPDEMKKHRYKIAVKTRNFFLYSYFILKNEKKSIYTST